MMSAEDPPTNCIFCKIVRGTAPADIIHQTDSVIVFRDLRPAAQHHILAVPKQHFKDAKSLTTAEKVLVEDLVRAAKEGLSLMSADLSDVRYGFHWPPFHTVAHLHLHAISPAKDMGLISRLFFKENSFWFVSPEYVLSRL